MPVSFLLAGGCCVCGGVVRTRVLPLFSTLISLATPVRNANWVEPERGMNQKVQQRK